MLTPESAPAGASCSDFSRTSSFTLKTPSNGEVDDKVLFLDIFIYLYFSVFFPNFKIRLNFISLLFDTISVVLYNSCPFGPPGHLAKSKISSKFIRNSKVKISKKIFKVKNFQSLKFSKLKFLSMSTFQKMSDYKSV